MTKDKSSLAARILNFDTKITMKDSKFLQFLFNYFVRVRSFIWSQRDIESEGMYAVS